MAGKTGPQTKKDAEKLPSVRKDQLPKLRKVLGSGELGNVLCETAATEAAKRETGLAALESQIRREVDGAKEDAREEFRALRTEAAAAKGAAGESREKADEAINVAAESVAMANSAKKGVKELGDQVANVATKDDVQEVRDAQQRAGTSLEEVRTELDAIAEAMTKEVETTDEKGNRTRKNLKGQELLNHLFGLVRTLQDSLAGFGEQIRENRKHVDNALQTADQALDTAEFNKELLETARQLVDDVNDGRAKDNQQIGERLVAMEKSAGNGDGNGAKKAAEQARSVAEKARSGLETLQGSLREFADNVDGKIQLVAMVVLGDDYEGDVKAELEKPSLELKR
ncbi:hypothetical protein GF318_02270 [Candidatus Micrarchaeota archaeon]|nr:hypothetical protein [Candidatus Micrarchaeota archaeon]